MLYRLVLTYIKVAVFLFYKKITITGKENIPKNTPVLFVVNHQNAMMDPLVVATTAKRSMYFLARASAFKNKIAAYLLNKVHAIAIYRVRDKVDSKKLNEDVFDSCLQLFKKNKTILIFPEGSHSVKRQIRSLRAGFTRMTIDYLKANPKKDLTIIPVGLNYDNTVNYAKKVHVIYGKPLKTRRFFDKTDLNKTKGDLINEVSEKLKEITVSIQDENYEAVFNSLTEEDYLHPIETNKKVEALVNNKTTGNKRQTVNNPKNLFYRLMQLNSIFPFLIWNWLEPKIEAKEFISTAKFSLGITVFPIFYFIQTMVVNSFFGVACALIYVALTFFLVILSTKTR